MRTALIVVAFAAGCGRDPCSRGGGEACYRAPGRTATASHSVAGQVGRDVGLPVALACPTSAPVQRTHRTNVMGGVSSPIKNVAATIAIYPVDQIEAPPIVTTKTNGAGGMMLSLPAGSPDRVTIRTQRPGGLDTYDLDIAIGADWQNRMMFGLVSVDRELLSALSVNLDWLHGSVHRDGTATILTAARDCKHERIAHAIVTLSATSSATGAPPKFVPGAEVYYTSETQLVLERRDQRTETGERGTAVIANIPPTRPGERYFIQTWGYPTDHDKDGGATSLKLLGEVSVPAPADAFVISGLAGPITVDDL